MRKACLNSIYQLARKDHNIIFIGSDLGHGVLPEFQKDLPSQFVMEGISEGHIIGMGSGMAQEGHIVYINTIASFLTRRCFEQISINLGIENLPVRLLGLGGGLVYGPLGPTHTCLDDFSLMRSVPNMSVFAPCDEVQMKQIIEKSSDYPGPMYIRIAKGGDRILSEGKELEIGKSLLLRGGQKTVIVAIGIMSQIAMEIASHYSEKGIEIAVINIHTLVPFDGDHFMNQLTHIKRVITLEEHGPIGGLADVVNNCLLRSNLDLHIKNISFPKCYVEEYGRQEEIFDLYRMNAEHLIKDLSDLILD